MGPAFGSLGFGGSQKLRKDAVCFVDCLLDGSLDFNFFGCLCAL